MNKRIVELTKLTLEGKMYASPNKTEYDREDLFLSRQKMESKRLCEFILNQEPVLTQYSKMTGFFNCGGSVVGDAFRRMGHKAFETIKNDFYLKAIDNLSTFEWQHATADYKKVLEKGIKGIIEEIDDSLKLHTETEEIEFLNALKDVANALIGWAHKCSDKALEFSKTLENTEHKKNLENLSKALKNVPENKPKSFYEAVLTIYVCFSADPDSVGTLDRYLRPFYEHDIENGVITREEAKEYLQELFLMLQSATHVSSSNFTRGGESHFCIGGYLPDGTDGFCDLSRLILEALLELPTWIPQVTLRWTAKTPKDVFNFALDCERKDPNKRIAFQNDEKRIKCYTKICGFPFEKAVGYTTVGCNEPAFLGAINGSNSKINFARSTETLFHKKSEKIIAAKTFDEYYEIFLQELFSDLDIAYEYDDKYNRERAKDINYLSSLFFQGTIEKAKSLTQGVGDIVIASPMLMGIPNVIDSLIIVKQFVFDEKIISMKELVSAVQNDWVGFEDLHTLIKNKGDFFGNDTERSNYVAQKLYHSIERNSFVDGPGIRTTVFFKGCNLKCAWCHNPESQDFKPQMMFYQDKCKGCGKCKEICPTPDRCTLCGKCTFYCPVDARKVCGREYTVDEVFAEIIKDKAYYDNSDGGVTFSGGECMLQIDFLLDILKKCKENGIHTAVDTAGHVPFESFEKILPYTDLFLYDIKIFDREKHKKYVGAHNDLILENLKKLFNAGAKIWIRVPVIADINDSTEEMQKIKSFLDNVGVPEKIELLPYHAMGENKYASIGKEAQHFSPPDTNKLNLLKAIF